MSSHIPWFRIHAQDIFSDKQFRDLSNADLGMWLRCMTIHAVDGGVPADSETLAKVLRIRPTSAAKCLLIIKKLFVPISDLPPDLARIATELTGDSNETQGHLYSEDLLGQIANYREKSLNNQANGRLGGRPKRGVISPKKESDRFSNRNQVGREEEQEGEVEREVDNTDTDYSFFGREEDPSGLVPSSSDGAGGDTPIEEWEGVPGLNPEESPAIQEVIRLYGSTAREVGLLLPSFEEVQDLSELLLSRISSEGWSESFTAALQHIQSMGREWWVNHQPSYSLRQLLRDGKVEEYAKKWRERQNKVNTTKRKPDATHFIPASLDDILGPHKKSFDVLVEIFGPKIKPLTDATTVRNILDSGCCTPEKMINAAKILFASRRVHQYMPPFGRWIQEGGYLIDTASPSMPSPSPTPSRSPMHRAEIDAQGMAQIERQRARKAANGSNGGANA